MKRLFTLLCTGSLLLVGCGNQADQPAAPPPPPTQEVVQRLDRPAVPGSKTQPKEVEPEPEPAETPEPEPAENTDTETPPEPPVEEEAEPPAEETAPEETAPEPPPENTTVVTAAENDLEIIANAAISGDAEAQYALGLVLKEDASTGEIRQMGWTWLSLAADSGHSEAPAALAEMEALMTADEIATAEVVKSQMEISLSDDPEVQAQGERDSQRIADITLIHEAMTKYMTDFGGGVPTHILINTAQEICKQGALDCAGYVSLLFLVDNGYLSSIPQDPLVGASTNSTRYLMLIDGNGVVTVAALDTETSTLPLSIRSE